MIPMSVARAVCGLLALATTTTLVAAEGAAQQTPDPGRIAGQVVNEANGRPLAQAQVAIVGTDQGTLTDVQGRYRTPPIPPGTYALEVTILGFGTTRVEGIVVEAGGTTIQNISLSSQAVEVEGLVIEAERVTRTSTEAALLAMQRNAAAVTDGISAQQIARSPDSDASDAIARVTGVSVVDDQFVVVRGLSERYSNTLLNGAELASPEPTRRVVPLNIFPASLLESVLTNKSATPDRPGDFAGGSVEIRTKEFPERRVMEFKLSGGFNSLATLQDLRVLRRQGGDYFGADGQGRFQGEPRESEAWAESLRNVWLPTPATVAPDLGFSVTLGDQIGEFENALGYILSFDYGLSTDHQPDRFFQFLTVNLDTGEPFRFSQAVTEQTTTGTDLGGVANVSWRLGSGHTLGLKNMWTRETEDLLNVRRGIILDDPLSGYTGRETDYQVRYVQRDFLQHQLTGNHVLPLNSSLDWKATYTRARRDEPENRTLQYALPIGSDVFELNQESTHLFWLRLMDEWSGGGQLDYSLPFPALWGEEGIFKTGLLYRTKRRDLDGFRVDFFRSGEGPWTLGPEQIFTPEIINRPNSDLLSISAAGPGQLPYAAQDDIAAGYGMVDASLLPGLRLVGGLRVEQWDLAVETSVFDDPTVDGPADSLAIKRSELDLLWSTNLTYELTDDMNLRGAAYRTLSRPDPRELALSVYVPLTGECSILGNPNLRDAKIVSLDGRWEWYPNPGELLAVSTFYKSFDNPFFQFARVSQGFGGCQYIPANGTSSHNVGLELEARANLGILGEAFEAFSGNLNLTLVDGEILSEPPDSLIEGDENFYSTTPLPLQDQSELLLNVGLGYENPEAGVTANVLLNWFSDRVARFGPSNQILNEDGIPVWVRGADFVELGRATLDAKLSWSASDQWSVSLSGRNLLNQRQEIVVETSEGTLPSELVDIGVQASLSLTWRPLS